MNLWETLTRTRGRPEQSVKHFRDQELGLLRMKQRAKRPKSAIMKPKSKLLFIVLIQGRAIGGKKKAWRKKIRKYELGRQPENTKLSSNKTVGRIRARGGNVKWHALRLDTGNYSWGSEAVTRKTRILDVVYNTSNNELVHTQTLVKSAIVQVDAAQFKQWYHYHKTQALWC